MVGYREGLELPFRERGKVCPLSTRKSAHLFVRPAAIEDVESLAAFHAALAWETEGKRLAEDRLRLGTRAVLEDPTRGFYLVAEDRTSPKVIAQLLVTYEWSDWRNAVFWWIQSVYVQVEWRRKGVFRHLYQYVLNAAKERGGVAGIRLYVESENTIAQGVYEKLGLTMTPYRIFEDDFVL